MSMSSALRERRLRSRAMSERCNRKRRLRWISHRDVMVAECQRETRQADGSAARTSSRGSGLYDNLDQAAVIELQDVVGTQLFVPAAAAISTNVPRSALTTSARRAALLVIQKKRVVDRAPVHAIRRDDRDGAHHGSTHDTAVN